MFINNFDPVAFQVLSIEIRWYSLAYIVGILIGWILSKKLFISDQSIKEKFDDFITYVIVGIIIGGRLGYVLFYNYSYYADNLLAIFKIWQGGMSFHGGLIGVVIASIWFSKKNNHDTFKYFDIISLVSPIGIFFGRISNFINSELYGRETDLLWSVKFVSVDNINRHPSQIYEAIFEGLILFIILNYLTSRINKKEGYVSSVFLIFYSIFRFVIEFTREPDAQIGLLYLNLSIGQIISIFVLFFGIYLWQSKKNV